MYFEKGVWRTFVLTTAVASVCTYSTALHGHVHPPNLTLPTFRIPTKPLSFKGEYSFSSSLIFVPNHSFAHRTTFPHQQTLPSHGPYLPCRSSRSRLTLYS